MKAPVYNMKNEKVGEMDVSDAVFNRPWNADLVHQVIRVKQANHRLPWAHTKTRDAVRGGGIKPWRQKGTGRARHGSRRSPLWKGGGVTFGPSNERSFEQKINKKMARVALHCLLSKKFSDGDLRFINNLTVSDHKTKSLVAQLKTLEVTHALLVPAHRDDSIMRACSNLQKVLCVDPNSLNIVDVLKYKSILVDQDSVTHIA